MKKTKDEIHKWLICISGFLQDEGKPTGMVRLFTALHAAHASPGTRLELRCYNDDWNALAEFIWRLRPTGAPPVIRIFAYSWGGTGALNLARELDRRGLKVDHIVLSDAVYRSDWLINRWLAMTPLPVLEVPLNVRQVTLYRQNRNLPAGHDVVPLNRMTTIHRQSAPFEKVDHEYMDDLNKFHRTAMEVAG